LSKLPNLKDIFFLKTSISERPLCAPWFSSLVLPAALAKPLRFDTIKQGGGLHWLRAECLKCKHGLKPKAFRAIRPNAIALM
jgi:hypothetical protein